jgi:hypothetical protein
MLTPLRYVRRWSVLVAILATVTILVPGTASAASANISGTTNSTNWVCYSTRRTVTTEFGRTVSLAANNLLGLVLSARLNNTNCAQIFTARSRVQEEIGIRKNFGTLNPGQVFQMGACCYSGDSVWGGNLRW